MGENKKNSPANRLIKRIHREFESCTYIGDIKISDDEYEILKQLLRIVYSKIVDSDSHIVINRVLAVALVQIGSRCYNSKYWGFVEEVIGRKLTPMQQGWLGDSFYQTLIRFNKKHVDKGEKVNNILMHCFITEYYSADLFDFLLAYYNIDIDRDLSRNTTDMKNRLMQSMAKNESSSRAYKIKKHTADAVMANVRGCKIRVGRILKFIDNAMFEDTLPENSQNRVAQLFCKWAHESKKYVAVKNNLRGLTRHGIKRYNTPYLHFDYSSKCFSLVVPTQNVFLDENESLPKLTWDIVVGERNISIEANATESVTGCKTNQIKDIIIASYEVFNRIQINLVKNSNETIKTFLIKEVDTRIFDNDWDSITIANNLPTKQLFAFTPSEKTIESDGLVGIELCGGLSLYNLFLEKGNYIRFPNESIKSAGKSLEEELMSGGKLEGAFISSNGLVEVYSSVPSIFFKASEAQLVGICLYINGKPNRLDNKNYKKCLTDSDRNKSGYILSLNNYIASNGIYEISLDIPKDKKNRTYKFAVVKGFKYDFIGAPYVFCDNGEIDITEEITKSSNTDFEKISANKYKFAINPENDYIEISLKKEVFDSDILIKVPCFKWKYGENGDWIIKEPKEIWHKDLPKSFFFSYPDIKVSVSMPPILATTDTEDEETDFEETFCKNKNGDYFECDTRKMLSWLGKENAIRPIYLKFESDSFLFAKVVTRDMLVGCQLEEDHKEGCAFFRSSILGYNDVVADIYYNDECIYEKKSVTSNGVKIPAPLKSGTLSITYFEVDDDDDEFGMDDFNYQKIAERSFKYNNILDISGKELIIEKFVEIGSTGSIFGPRTYYLNPKVKITDIDVSSSQSSAFVGHLHISENLSNIIQVDLVALNEKELAIKTEKKIFYDSKNYMLKSSPGYNTNEINLCKYRFIYKINKLISQEV